MNKNNIIWIIFAVLVLFGLYTILSNESNNGKQVNTLVTRYCGSCHHVPSANALTKSMWEKGVFPRMAEYFKWSDRSRFNYANRNFYAETGTIPMSDTIWATLQSYFVEGGLDEPVRRQYGDLPIQNYFDVQSVLDICDGRGITSVTLDEYNHTIIAACDSTLFTINQDGESVNSINSGGLVSGVFPLNENTAWVLDPGVLDPHDASFGTLKQWDLNNASLSIIKSELSRPIYLTPSDSNLFISEFGNEKGRLSEFNIETLGYTSASTLPGAYKSIIFDYDKDGNDEILVMFAQALEGIYVREVDDPKKSFVPVLSFTPEWGVSDMDTLDVNNDGWTDLVVVNGDNADYSIMPKAYHGVRIYLNNKKGRFEETYSFPLHGATQVQTLDANGDGFNDILVGSFFAIDKKDRLMLLLSDGDRNKINYTPYRFLEAQEGRWMVMNTGDIDGDGDKDAIIGSFEIVSQSGFNEKGEKGQTDLLLLLNKSK